MSTRGTGALTAAVFTVGALLLGLHLFGSGERATPSPIRGDGVFSDSPGTLRAALAIPLRPAVRTPGPPRGDAESAGPAARGSAEHTFNGVPNLLDDLAQRLAAKPLRRADWEAHCQSVARSLPGEAWTHLALEARGSTSTELHVLALTELVRFAPAGAPLALDDDLLDRVLGVFRRAEDEFDVAALAARSLGAAGRLSDLEELGSAVGADGAPALVQAALHGLACGPPEVVAPRLAELVRVPAEGDEAGVDLSARAMIALVRLGESGGTTAWTRDAVARRLASVYLSDGAGTSLRGRALRALAAWSPDEAQRAGESVLSDVTASDETFATTLRQLAALPAALDVVGPLLRETTDPDRQVLLAEAVARRELASTPDPALLLFAEDVLRRAAEHGEDASLRRKAVHALAGIGGPSAAADLRLAARSDPDSTVRGAAIVALGALGTLDQDASTELLEELELHDDSEAVRRLAAHAGRESSRER